MLGRVSGSMCAVLKIIDWSSLRCVMPRALDSANLFYNSVIWYDCNHQKNHLCGK